MSAVAIKKPADDQENVERLAQAIAEKMAGPPPLYRLWDAADCAEYFKVSRESFLKYKATQPSFPAPHGPGHPRWFPDEVIEWAKANRAV